MLGIMTYSKLLANYTPAYTFMLVCCYLSSSEVEEL